VGAILLALILPALNRAKQQAQQDNSSMAAPTSALPATAQTLSFGPVLERVIHSVAAQRPIRLLDMDSDEEVEVPAERENGTEEQFFFWISEQGVDLMGQSHRDSWTLTTSLKLVSLDNAMWMDTTPAGLRAAFNTGTNGLPREDTVFGYDQYRLKTNSELPLSFAFETRQNTAGLLQITGFTDNPRGLKIRYKLVQPKSAEQPAVVGGRDPVAVIADTIRTNVGRTEDFMLPFVNDPQVLGEWVSVDFVASPAEFNPDKPSWKDTLHLIGLSFREGGKTSQPWYTWTKGIVFHHGDKTASHYEILELKGQIYMFFEWKSRADMIAGKQPGFYVLKKAVVREAP
jgi:hypothetical protein